ncbi:MAG: DUF3108 domain-containing protein [Pyrinomonadaceae bacterium]
MSKHRLRLICFLLLLLFALTALVGVAQKPIQPVPSRPFEPVEQLFYEAEFSRLLVRKLDVADFKFIATRILPPVSGQAEPQPYALTFSADVVSKGFFARLFNLKFRERVESTVEPGSFTVQRTTILDEQGKRVRTSEATFDPSEGKMVWTQRDPNNPAREPRMVTATFSGQLQDVLSAIYFIRTQPLQLGHSFEIFVGDSGRVYRVPVKVVEKKKMKTIFGAINVWRVEPQLFGADSLIDDEKGEFTIWITDDNRRIPVGGRIKSDFGTFDIKLKKVVYNPLDSSKSQISNR